MSTPTNTPLVHNQTPPPEFPKSNVAILNLSLKDYILKTLTDFEYQNLYVKHVSIEACGEVVDVAHSNNSSHQENKESDISIQKVDISTNKNVNNINSDQHFKNTANFKQFLKEVNKQDVSQPNLWKKATSSSTQSRILAGTLIKTINDQNIKIENLSVGDEVLSFDFNTQQKTISTVKSISKKDIVINNKTEKYSYPIRILKNAIAPNVPSQDSLVTPEYCFFFNNYFIPVVLLVNNYNIFYDYSVTQYSYYYVKLENDAVVWTNNVLSKICLDDKKHSIVKTNAESKSLFTQPFNVKKQKKDIVEPITTNTIIIKTLFNKFLTRARKMGIQQVEYINNNKRKSNPNYNKKWEAYSSIFG